MPILDRHGAPSRVVIVKATYAIGAGGALCRPRSRATFDSVTNRGARPNFQTSTAGRLLRGQTGYRFRLERPRRAAPCWVRTPTSTSGDSCRGPNETPACSWSRQWRRSLLGVIPSQSDPLESTPLAWSRAYGGLDLTDPNRPLEDARNPVGSGIARDVERLIGTPAPQIEAPDTPIGAAGGRFVPIGCAPLGRNFAPRRETMGTYDKAWLDSVYPGAARRLREEHETARRRILCSANRCAAASRYR